MKKYQAILFDLFGTIILFDRSRLPVFEWQGQTSHSTMGHLRLFYEEKALPVPFARFFSALSDVSKELEDARSHSLREFSSLHRFLQGLLRAGFSFSAETCALAEQLALTHMGVLAGAALIPEEYVTFLAQVRDAYALAAVSNFDHAPTARGMLQAKGIEKLFQHIAISDEHGWRKPHPKIFADALTALGAAPEAALFVGDSPQDDIIGAKAVGMDVAWVNARGATFSGDVPAPDYTISAIPELRRLLF